MRTIDYTEQWLKTETPRMILTAVSAELTLHVSSPAVSLALQTVIFTSLIKIIVVRLELNQKPVSVCSDRVKFKASLTVMESSWGFY